MSAAIRSISTITLPARNLHIPKPIYQEMGCPKKLFWVRGKGGSWVVYPDEILAMNSTEEDRKVELKSSGNMSMIHLGAVSRTGRIAKKTGQQYLNVFLPSSWTRENNISSGNEVEIYTSDVKKELIMRIREETKNVPVERK